MWFIFIFITKFTAVDRRVWFEITEWDFDKRRDTERSVGSDSDFYLALSNTQKVHPFQNENILTDGVYLSYGEYMRIHFKTGDAPNGRGFKGVYKTGKKIETMTVLFYKCRSRYLPVSYNTNGCVRTSIRLNTNIGTYLDTPGGLAPTLMLAAGS